MYTLLRACVRAALHLYFGKIHVDLGSTAPPAGAVLVAANHPNSFLDALVIAAFLPYRMRFLARGDAFRNPMAAKVLRALYMIPIFRMSEGRTELRRTEASFRAAQQDLEAGGSVLVFSEGLSVNAHGLRPLGKGTARIAHRAWGTGLDVPVVPVWLNYRQFRKPFMEVDLCTGSTLHTGGMILEPQAVFLRDFNAVLRERLLAASFRADAVLAGETTPNPLAKVFLLLPALAGLVLHAPWYFPLRAFTGATTRGTVFFDSVLFGLLFLSYPLWLLMLTAAGLWLGMQTWALLVWLIAPLCLLALRAWCRRS